MSRETAIEGFNRQVSIALDAAKVSFEKGDYLEIQSLCNQIISDTQQLQFLEKMTHTERTNEN